MSILFDYRRQSFKRFFEGAAEIVERNLLDDVKCVSLFRELVAEFVKYSGNHNLVISDIQLLSAVRSVLQNIKILSGVHFSTIIQTKDKNIFLNPVYLVSNSTDEDDRCIVILIVKLLHEIAQILTNTFMVQIGEE